MPKLMHNSCTSAIEATIFKKPVITYMPFEQNILQNYQMN